MSTDTKISTRSPKQSKSIMGSAIAVGQGKAMKLTLDLPDIPKISQADMFKAFSDTFPQGVRTITPKK